MGKWRELNALKKMEVILKVDLELFKTIRSLLETQVIRILHLVNCIKPEPSVRLNLP